MAKSSSLSGAAPTGHRSLATSFRSGTAGPSLSYPPARAAGPSFSSVDRARADRGARARTAERLIELLGPLDPARHVTYLEGVQAALAGYDDAQNGCRGMPRRWSTSRW
jgi:hypothetical protein